MTKKIKIQIPQFINEILKYDIDKFKISKNKLANIIFEQFNSNYQVFKELNKQNISFQFNLNDKNTEIYNVKKNSGDFFNKQINTDAILFRSFFYSYIQYPANKREIFIFKKVYDDIINAIDNELQISIKVQEGFRTIEPFFISTTKEERYNYICCYCYKNKKIVNYRLNKIVRIIPLKQEQKYNNKEKIKEYRNNFDPYLSHNKIIKIKLTNNGVKLYKDFTFTPNIIKKEGNIYYVEASDLRAKLFFPLFMEEVEILEPIQLRNWFRDKIKIMQEIYK